MDAVSLPGDQKSLVIFVDTEHRCQLFYRSLPPPRLLSFFLSAENSPENTKGHESLDPWPSLGVATGLPCPWHPASRYAADAPGRARTRISPTRGSRGVISSTGQLYGLARSRSSIGAATALRSLGRGAQDERLDRDQVVGHRLPGRARIALRDRLENSTMVLMRARRPPWRVERFLAALSQEIHDRVHDPCDRAIVGGGADRRVKGRVLGDARPPGGDLPGLALEDPLHVLHLVRGRAARRERRDGRLQDPAGLEELPDRLPLRGHHEGQRADHRVDRHLANERALARTDPDEPQALDAPPRAACRGPADDELLGELALRRQPVAGLEAAFRDQLLALPDELLVNARRLDRPELDGLIVRSLPSGRAHRRLRASPARGRAGGRGPATSREPSPGLRARSAPPGGAAGPSPPATA